MGVREPGFLFGSSEQGATGVSSRDHWIACGIFLVVLAVYILSSPGRIDIIDSQYRFDVAQNLLRYGRPYLLDPALINPLYRVVGWDGGFYSTYGFAESGFSLPLVWLGSLFDNGNGETTRFFFSLTTCFFGALCASVLYLFYRELRVSRSSALFWTAVGAFATLLWPLSASTFENVQRGFLALCAVFLGYRSAKRRSLPFALAGGIVAGMLFLYRWYSALLIPFLALSTLSSPATETELPSPDRVKKSEKPSPLVIWAPRLFQEAYADLLSFLERSGKGAENRARFKIFLEGCAIGFAGFLGYNLLRFNSLFETSYPINVSPLSPAHESIYINPLAGFLTLFVSPGKSIILYSPPIILGLIGIRYLWRRERWLAYALVGASALWASMMCVTYYTAGDWCWGPRYTTNVLPLWALPLPLLRPGKFMRRLAITIVGLGLAVQLMAVSMDFQRFFFERHLGGYFYIQDNWFYFKHSALLARPSEIISLKDGIPPGAYRFSPTPYPGSLTYTIFGLTERTLYMSDRWVRRFQLFYLPRPWPFWMLHIEPYLRPINLLAWVVGCLGLMLLGVAFIGRGVSVSADSSPPH